MLRSLAVVVVTYVALEWLGPEKVGFPTFLTSALLLGAAAMSHEKDIVAAVRSLWRPILFGTGVFLFPAILSFKNNPWIVPVALSWTLFVVIAFNRLQQHLRVRRALKERAEP